MHETTGPVTETADTITEAQILEVRRLGNRLLSEAIVAGTDREYAFDLLLNSHNALMRDTCTSDGNGSHYKWRARCAEILNARAEAKS